ncbi:MAG: hypothetical protein WC389_04230 [Lutibacter sp.]|jgi:hypothetical protein
MEITIIDRIVLLVTGGLALYLMYSFYNKYKAKQNRVNYNLWYIASFTVLLVAGLLLILFGFSVLSSPFTKIVATIIPFGIALGLIKEFYPKYYPYYLGFLILGFLLIMLVNINVFQARAVYPVFHAASGLTIFLVPFMVARAKITGTRFIWVGIGGALIGIGGMAMASLSFGKPLMGIFTEGVVFTILTPILLLMSMSFAYGFEKKVKISNSSTL